MGARYGAMFAGQTPPTAADIDAHHDALARGDAAQILWNRDEAGGQPLGTKVAATDLVGDGLLAANLWRSALMAKRAADAARGIDTTPFTPAENKGFKEALIPPPVPDPNDTGGFTPVEPKPNHTGHAAPEPVGTEPLVNVPELQDGIREELIGNVADLFGTILEQTIYGDGKRDGRGGDETILGTNILIEECIADIKEVGAEGRIVHKGGGSWDGRNEKYAKESTIKGVAGTNRSDAAFGLENEKDPTKFSHFNTVSTRKDGTLTPRENAAIQRIARNIGRELIQHTGKLRRGDDPDEYRRGARRVARKGLVPLYKLLGLDPPPLD